MEVSQCALAFMLMSAFLCGVVLGGVYDIFRMTRQWLGAPLPPAARQLQCKLAVPRAMRPIVWRRKKHPGNRTGRLSAGVLLFAEDIIFCLLSAVVLILLLYQTNDGQFRFSVITSATLGFAVYWRTLGRWVKLISATITVIAAAIFRWSVAILLFPFAWIIRWVYRRTMPIRRRIRDWLLTTKETVQRRLYQWKQKMQNKRTKENDPHIRKTRLSEQIRARGVDGKSSFVSGRVSDQTLK